jgi:hypothetical protein
MGGWLPLLDIGDALYILLAYICMLNDDTPWFFVVLQGFSDRWFFISNSDLHTFLGSQIASWRGPNHLGL